MEWGIYFIATLVIGVAAYFFVTVQSSANRRAERRGETPDPIWANIGVPQTVGEHWRSILILLFVVFVLVPNCYTIVPPAHMGLKISGGDMEDFSYPSGLYLKIPFYQKFITVPTYAYSTEVIESTASSDLQEIQTKLSVQYQVIPSMAHIVYKAYLLDWEITQINPIIYEEMKGTTADWTAEQLIQERPRVMAQLRDQLRERLNPLGFTVISVNIEDLQFSPEYWDAIEKKAVAVQNALAEKNKLEIVRYQQQQLVLIQEAEKNMTIIDAQAHREKQIQEAEGLAQSILLEANATAEGEFMKLDAIARGMAQIREQLTPEYVDYLIALGWDGKLPVITDSGGGMIIDLRTILALEE